MTGRPQAVSRRCYRATTVSDKASSAGVLGTHGDLWISMRDESPYKPGPVRPPAPPQSRGGWVGTRPPLQAACNRGADRQATCAGALGNWSPAKTAYGRPEAGSALEPGPRSAEPPGNTRRLGQLPTIARGRCRPEAPIWSPTGSRDQLARVRVVRRRAHCVDCSLPPVGNLRRQRLWASIRVHTSRSATRAHPDAAAASALVHVDWGCSGHDTGSPP